MSQSEDPQAFARAQAARHGPTPASGAVHRYRAVRQATEALTRSLRKIIKTRGSFPTDEAATKLLYLAIRNAGVHWRRPIAWTAAMSQFAIQFEERFAGPAD